jgi:hypothetical protein
LPTGLSPVLFRPIFFLAPFMALTNMIISITSISTTEPLKGCGACLVTVGYVPVVSNFCFMEMIVVGLVDTNRKFSFGQTSIKKHCYSVMRELIIGYNSGG